MKIFDRYVDDFTDSFLTELVIAGIIKQVKNPFNPEEKAYQLVSQVDDNAKTTASTTTTTTVSNQSIKDKNIIQSFYDFRNIILLIYQSLIIKWGAGKQLKISEIVDKFVELGVFSLSWKDVLLLRDFLDNADDLLPDDEIKEKTIGLLEKHKVNFNKLVLEILKFYSCEAIKAYDKDLVFEENITRDVRSFFDYKVSKNSSDRHLFLEVKFRKKNYSTKELIQQCIEVLNKTSTVGEPQNQILLIVYSYGNLTELERNRFKFKQNMEEGFREFTGQINFLPIGINHLDIVEKQVANILISVWNKKAIRFKFFNQQIKSDHPKIDDHYFDEVFDLSKYRYEISFRPITTINHWRFGVKFSKEVSFPEKEDRHPIGYPVFHITKNIESNQLFYTFYNPDNVNVERPTKMLNYMGEKLVLNLIPAANTVIIDVVDIAGSSILEPLIVLADYKYCKVFAWADSNNRFEFESEIFEIQLK